MSGSERDAGRRPWPGDSGARRLFTAVRRACDGGEDLPTCLESGLGAALRMLAHDPTLARLLTVQPDVGTDEWELEVQGAWSMRFAALLSEAAARDPRVTARPSFVAPVLIGGLRFQIARLVLSGESSELPRLLPVLVETLLACYFEPGGADQLLRARDG